jgi:DNA-binding response OmpR family regulator
VVSRTDIEENLYEGRAELNSNAVESAICALRRRLDVEGESSLIETRRGMGYVLRENSVG